MLYLIVIVFTFFDHNHIHNYPKFHLTYFISFSILNILQIIMYNFNVKLIHLLEET